VAVTGLDNKASTNTFYLNILPPGFIPYVEPFMETTLPSGWHQTTLSGNVEWKSYRGTYSGYSLSDTARYPKKPVSETNNLCLWGMSGYRAELVTTPFDLGGCTNTALSFNLAMKRYLNDSGKQDYLAIWYDTHQDNNWKPLMAFDDIYFAKSNAVLFSLWTNVTFALPEPSATYRLKFVGQTWGGWGICVDDLVVLGERTAPPLVITTPDPLPQGTNGVVYSDFALEATGGTALPYTWRIVTSDIFPPGLTLNPTNGIISGTPTQYGIYTFGVTVQDANNVTTTQQYTLQILSGGLTPFETWKSLYFPTLGSYLGDDADQSGDGIPNLIKYGMGLNPTTLNTGTYILGGLTNVVGAPLIGDGNYLYFVYRRSLTATDLDFFVKGKTNLADVAELWTTNNIVQLTPWSVGQTGVWSWVYNMHTTPITNAPQRFLRLEVQLQP
jgi:Putative Ig domain